LYPLIEVSLEIVGVVILPGVAGPEVDVVVAVVVAPEVSELVFVAVDIAYVSGPQASVHIAFVFAVLIPVCAGARGGYPWPPPGLLSSPRSIRLPTLPVLVKSVIRNPLRVPHVSVPIMGVIVSSPMWIYVKIETWNIVIVDPIPVIIS
jgi:hypothetical protein